MFIAQMGMSPVGSPGWWSLNYAAENLVPTSAATGLPTSRPPHRQNGNAARKSESDSQSFTAGVGQKNLATRLLAMAGNIAVAA
jgi:hypothetical protein